MMYYVKKDLVVDMSTTFWPPPHPTAKNVFCGHRKILVFFLHNFQYEYQKIQNVLKRTILIKNKKVFQQNMYVSVTEHLFLYLEKTSILVADMGVTFPLVNWHART